MGWCFTWIDKGRKGKRRSWGEAEGKRDLFIKTSCHSQLVGNIAGATADARHGGGTPK